ncbi:CURVATURE THYLAKOID 1B, chloroplastic-like [Olea europaea subsp. europaea]|uniref:CURVATURE THYLAKOID 1B, chloroplastic-like n=1 Tax=Olea europaea subsp. europaea TaxID=158383 RepID=A0A8S0SE92_OLEEU|nr:CURVATURE THYLAKOID 1B, chloroplastic-like [Olea europaea subsp. europaea]
MASSTSTPLSLSSSSSSTLIDTKAPTRQSAAASSQWVALPTLPPPPVQSQSRAARTTAYCRKIARNVMAMATGEAPAEVVATAELPEIVKTIQESWDKVEDKYAVTSLAVAGGVAVFACSGMISVRTIILPSFVLVSTFRCKISGYVCTPKRSYEDVSAKIERMSLFCKRKALKLVKLGFSLVTGN